MLTLFLFCKTHHAPVNIDGELRLASEPGDDGNYELDFTDQLRCTGDPFDESWQQPCEINMSITTKL